MNKRLFGVYGFEFSKEFDVDGISVVPLYGATECKTIAANRQSCCIRTEFPCFRECVT
jgi:hypothetical protein